MRLAISTALVSGVLAVFGVQAHADAAIKRFAIPAQAAPAALNEFARQADVTLVFSYERVANARTNEVHGAYPVTDALARLIEGTALSYKQVGESTIAIGEGATSMSESAATPQPEGPALEEIVVSAQKRLERLQDVPVPVTALAAESLVNSNQLRLYDYYTRIPGLSVTPGDGITAPQLTIRGVTTGGFTNPTVGVVVDDVPYGSSTAMGGGNTAPDIDPSELARVEVLRGPQGTLYGASSLGGLLKFVTLDPSTEAVSGRVQAGFNSVRNGDELGYNLRAAVNVPLSDSWALRASGFTRLDPGFVDNVQTGQRGVNRGEADGGRLSALWRPTDAFSLKLSALLQSAAVDGAAQTRPTLGELKQSVVRGSGFFSRDSEVFSAVITARLAGVDLTAASGYMINEYADAFDFPALYDASLSTFGVAGAIVPESNRTRKFTQEIRATGSIGPRTEWLLGTFYTQEDSQLFQSIVAAEPVTGQVAGEWYRSGGSPTEFEEYALFADVTYHFTEAFDVQIGGRQSRNENSFPESTSTGPLVGGVSLSPAGRARDDAFTYLVTPRLKIAPDLMTYVRLASGYRVGFPQTVCIIFADLPCSYAPDKTRTYEVGIKGDVLDRTVSFDASAYYIEWQDIQVSVFDASKPASYIDNVGQAKSQGVELSVEAKPLQGLAIAAWVAWNDATLTEDFPPGTFGRSGDRLPNSSRFSGNVALDHEFPLPGNTTGFVGGSVSYVGNRKGVFLAAAGERQELPAYVTTDLRAGAHHGNWTVNLFINNVTDRRGILTGGVGTFDPTVFYYIQPRSGGVSVTKVF
jgi:iron complex outermembrane recepter protein